MAWFQLISYDFEKECLHNVIRLNFEVQHQSKKQFFLKTFTRIQQDNKPNTCFDLWTEIVCSNHSERLEACRLQLAGWCTVCQTLR